MEKQSSIQTKSNEVFEKLKQNLNYIYIVLLFIVNMAMNLLVIEDGKIEANYPTSTLGWILWGIRLFLQTMLGVLILNAFRREGIRMGHKNPDVKKAQEEYIKTLRKAKKFKPRSQKEYLSGYGARDSASKSTIFVITTIFVTSLLIGANWNNILSLILNTILSVGFGIKALMQAEEYVLTELIIWYQLKTAEVTDQKLEPAKEDEECQNLIMTESASSQETCQDKSSSTDEKMLNKTNDSQP